MLSSLLLAAAAAVILLLGCVHLLYTFVGPKLQPRDAALREAMQRVSPVITGQTTMWRAWVGFNASHSLGAMLFGLVYGYLALAMPAVLFGSAFLLLVGAGMLLALWWLARCYWFHVPFFGVSVAALLYLAAVLVNAA